MTVIAKTVYRAFGLTLTSDFPLPELPSAAEEENPIDVTVERADLSSVWALLEPQPNKFVVHEGAVYFRVPGAAVFSVEDGARIRVSPESGAEESKIRLYILGTCVGALLQQRRVLPLHGSALAIDGKAIAIVGESGVGKSTLASVFLSKGFELLSDDVVAVKFGEDQIPWVMPAYPQQKLWKESLHELGMGTNGYQPLFERETKFLVPVSSRFTSRSLPLSGVFELVRKDGAGVELEPIKGLSQLRLLFEHTFRNSLLFRLGLMEWHFGITSKLSTQIGLYRLRRPQSGFTANELAELIIQTIRKGEHE